MDEDRLSILRGIKLYLKVADAEGILRRYAVMNGFDGAMTTLGVLIGSAVFDDIPLGYIIHTVLGASLAMFVSGVWSVFLVERAERARYLKRLEKVLFRNLDGSLIERAHTVASMIVALVDGSSPVLASLASITPMIVGMMLQVSRELCLMASLICNLTLLFILGVILGYISKGRLLLHGVMMLSAGLVAITIAMMLGGIGALR
jgi:predicted membrane protein (TIGR00267 family)